MKRSQSTMLLPSAFWATLLFYVFLQSSSNHRFTKGVEAWSPNLISNSFISSKLHRQTLSTTTCNDPKDPPLSGENQSYSSSFVPAHHDAVVESRRSFLNVASISACLIGSAVVVGIHPPMADAATGGDSAATQATRYISGKPPQVPGQTPQDKSNLKGTKKDPDFLRSIADCRSQCQNTLGPDGLSKAKEDCLSECQDICCRTYEQCTFNIVPRL